MALGPHAGGEGDLWPAEHLTACGDLAERLRPAAVLPPVPAIDWRGLRKADHACCCPAKPVVVVVMPPAPGREHAADLLLCGHHCRVSRLALMAAGAALFDGVGRTVMPPARALAERT